MSYLFMTLNFSVYSMLLLATFTYCHFPDPNLRLHRCLRTDETLSWNRTFLYNNHSLNLTLEVTDRPSHWILNYIFAIIAHERLGYQNITFAEFDQRKPSDIINRLKCSNENCTKLPKVHVNLEMWLPLGTSPSFWVPSNQVTDHGPLGPVSRWALLISPDFIDPVHNLQDLDTTCDPILHSVFRQYRDASNTHPEDQTSEHWNSTAKMLSINWNGDGPEIPPSRNCNITDRYSLFDGDFVPTPLNHYSYCRFGTQQATKLTWAKLQSSVPLIYQLVNRMNFTQSDYDRLLSDTRPAHEFASEGHLRTHYYELACGWVRRHQNHWKWWTENWEQKQTLTVAGLFSTYGKWVYPGLEAVAQSAVDYVNNSPDYLAKTEYALHLDIHNLTCMKDIVVNDLFLMMFNSSKVKTVGILGALCSDVIGPVIDVAKQRKIIIVSPTAESERINQPDSDAYFFRTIPSMRNVNMALVRFFNAMNWKRAVIFREGEYFFNTGAFQKNNVDIIIDSEMTGSQLSFEYVQKIMEQTIKHNSRIFLVEHFARGTALILCVAYHLGMHSDAGYVWVINSWLTGDWWKAPGVMPTECNETQMLNTTAWTFTMTQQMLLSPQLYEAILEPVSFSPGYHDYVVYTYESLIVLARGLVSLLRFNPRAISVLESPSTASLLRDLVHNVRIDYTDLSRSHVWYRQRRSAPKNESFGDIAANTSSLRFNVFHDRNADFWLLQQRQFGVNKPMLAIRVKADRINPPYGLTGASELASVDEFNRHVFDQWLGTIHWPQGSIPTDGSIPFKACAFDWIGRLLGVNCATATAMFWICLILLIALPLFALFIVYYRRKLKEAERLIRQPYEELCAELADIDIPAEDIYLNRQVGQGAFGMVYGGEAKRNGTWEAVAVKVIGSKASYEGKKDFLSEAKLMRNLDHKNVVKLIGICLRPPENHLYLIMEVMLLGDLRTYLLSRRVMAQQTPDHEDICPATLTQMATNIAEGVGYLHLKSLVHRDIACRNCLVGSDRVVKIGDFGLTRQLTNLETEGYYRFTRNCQLPIRWMSPEIFQFGVFSVQSDLWSYGIVLYEIITFGVHPYEGLDEVVVVESVKQNRLSILDFLPASACNTPIAALIGQCCQFQWQHRPASMDYVIQRLRENPECVRPCLTDEPPKSTSKIDALPFKPGAGACMMSENAIVSDGPTPSGINVTDSISNNHSTGTIGLAAVRGFHSTTGSLIGAGRSSLAYYSADSFPEATSAALRLLASENAGAASGRRRHKTADNAVNKERSTFFRLGTNTSSGDEGSRFQLENVNANQNSNGPLVDTNPAFLQGWSAVSENSKFHSTSVKYQKKADKSRLVLFYNSDTGASEHTCTPSAMATKPPDNDSYCNGPAGPLKRVLGSLDNPSLHQQSNGILVSNPRSLSTGQLIDKTNEELLCYRTKSAPEHQLFESEFDQSTRLISPVCCEKGLKCDGNCEKKLFGVPTSPNFIFDHVTSRRLPSTGTRFVKSSAAQRLRSLIRLFGRIYKGEVSRRENTNVRGTVSSMSCRTFDHTNRSGDVPTDSHDKADDRSHLYTSCPPLLLSPLSQTADKSASCMVQCSEFPQQNSRFAHIVQSSAPQSCADSYLSEPSASCSNNPKPVSRPNATATVSSSVSDNQYPTSSLNCGTSSSGPECYSYLV